MPAPQERLSGTSIFSVQMGFIECVLELRRFDFLSLLSLFIDLDFISHYNYHLHACCLEQTHKQAYFFLLHFILNLKPLIKPGSRL